MELTQEQFGRALDEVDTIVLDVETHNTQTYTGKKLMGVAIGIPAGLGCNTYYILPEDLHLYKARLSQVDIIAHNVLFDSEIMQQNGVPLNGKWWDTLTMAHINNENEFNFGLDFLCKKYIGRGKTDMKAIIEVFGWNNIPTNIMSQYAQNDADITWGLYLHLASKLAEQDLMKVYNTYVEYLKATRWIQSGGIVVDWSLVERKRDEAELRLKQIRFKELRFDPGKRSAVDDFLYNQLKLPILRRSAKSRKPQTDVAVLQTLRRRYPEHNPVLDLILEYRNVQKANGNWYAGYLKYKDDTGLIHPNFKVHGTKTGRLSCESPNLQQIPRDYGRVKCLFGDNPSAGEVLVELDYSQIELRVAAYYSMLRGDDTMYKLYEAGEDVHTKTTEMVGAFNQIPDKKEARQVGKTGNFLWIYGGGAAKMRSQLFQLFGFRSSVEQCQEWGAKFHEAYPGFRLCLHHAEQLHKSKQYIKLWNGRRRRIRERGDYGVKHHIAFNSQVQGGCGQLLMYALIRIHKAYEAGELQSRVVNTVHDSIWVYVPKDHFDEEVAELTRLMRMTPEKVFKLPFEVDTKVMVQT